MGAQKAGSGGGAMPSSAEFRQILGDTRRMDAVSSSVAALDEILDLLFMHPSSHEGEERTLLEILFRRLIEILSLDFVCFRMQDASQHVRFEIIDQARTDCHRCEVGDLRRLLSRTLSTNADDSGTASLRKIRSTELFQLHFSIDQMRAVFIAGASRYEFPSPAEQLVLNVAARKIVGSLGKQPYDQRQVALSALEQLAARMGTRLDLGTGFVAGSVGVDTRERYYQRKHSVGMPDWRLRELFDLLPIMAWSSFPDGACEFLNRAHYEYTGLTAAQSKDWGWQVAIHPKDLAHRMEKWHESTASGRPSEAEVRIRRHDGVYRWFLFRIEPFRDRFGEIVRWYGVATDIEDRKRAEENWSASEKRLGLIVNTIPMLIWSSLPDGHADFFNEQWSRYTGFSFSQSDGWGWARALHVDDFRRTTQHWRTITTTGDQDDNGFEVRIRRADGEYRWFWLRANAMRDELGVIKRWYVTCTDIHDRKLAEEGVRRSEALLAEAQRLAGLGTFSWRVGSDIITGSSTLQAMFGFEAGVPITRAMIESRTHPEDASFIFEKINDEKDSPATFEEQVRILMPDGAVKYLQYCAYATTALTGEVEYVGTVQDITERHLASEALAQARAELAQAARASSLGVLTASIAHEVNQPLAGIITNANTSLRMLNNESPNVAGAIETARRIIRDGNRAADVIARLRNLFSQKEINTSWWDLVSATREVIELAQRDLRKNRIALTESYDSELSLVVGDRIQMQQVILNLIRNAIDAVQANADGPREVAVSVSCRDDCAHLCVKDTGIGFDISAADKLFEAFYTTKRDGMGIGLSVSRWIVEAHGGSLWGRKNEERGATFGFSIPCHGTTDSDNHPDDTE
ncbi:PAS domain S-box protein [Paraburkholderia bengalensis]|uniref:histidine kinase n=1 Tax=Paraburkholderia bengalensis TaxID=2747562 RepID=A0ABU8J074_9BURK